MGRMWREGMEWGGVKGGGIRGFWQVRGFWVTSGMRDSMTLLNLLYGADVKRTFGTYFQNGRPSSSTSHGLTSC